jgi:hypothetical protein
LLHHGRTRQCWICFVYPSNSTRALHLIFEEIWKSRKNWDLARQTPCRVVWALIHYLQRETPKILAQSHSTCAELLSGKVWTQNLLKHRIYADMNGRMRCSKVMKPQREGHIATPSQSDPKTIRSQLSLLMTEGEPEVSLERISFRFSPSAGTRYRWVVSRMLTRACSRQQLRYRTRDCRSGLERKLDTVVAIG